MLQFVASWFDDMPAAFVTPGHTSFSRDDLDVALRRALAASPRWRIGRQDYFAPQIPDRSTRVAMALTPTLSVRLAEDGEWIRAIPMCRGSALWRSIIRQAVLEEHAQPWTREDPDCSENQRGQDPGL